MTPEDPVEVDRGDLADPAAKGAPPASPPAAAALDVNTTEEAVSGLPTAANIGW